MPTIADIRKAWGSDYDNWSDGQIADYYAQYHGISEPVARAELGIDQRNQSALQDVGTSLKRGTYEIPGMATGFLDAITAPITGDRYFDRGANALGKATGLQPAEWAKRAADNYSIPHEQAQQEVEHAWNSPDTDWKDIVGAYAKNPALIANITAESLPSAFGGGLIGRALTKLALKQGLTAAERAALVESGATAEEISHAVAASRQAISPIAGAGIGEGAITAGQNMDQTDRSADPRTAGLANLAGGAITGMIGYGAGRVANKLGLTDLETAIAGQKNTGGSLNLLNKIENPVARAGARIGGGMAEEGLLQEFPQSMQEQMWQNYAEGKPVMEGALRQGIEGGLSGAGLGGVANLRGGHPVQLPDLNATNQPIDDSAPTDLLQQRANTYQQNFMLGLNQANQEMTGPNQSPLAPYLEQAHLRRISADALASYPDPMQSRNVPGNIPDHGLIPQQQVLQEEEQGTPEVKEPPSSIPKFNRTALRAAINNSFENGQLTSEQHEELTNALDQRAKTQKVFANFTAAIEGNQRAAQAPQTQQAEVPPVQQAAQPGQALPDQGVTNGNASEVVHEGGVQTPETSGTDQVQSAQVPAVAQATEAPQGVQVQGNENLTPTPALTVESAPAAAPITEQPKPVALSKKLQREARDKQIVYDALGWDSEGHQAHTPMTLEAIAEKHGMTKGRVSQILRQEGHTKESLGRLRSEGTNTETANVADLAASQQEEGGEGGEGNKSVNGYSIVNSPNSNVTVEDAKTKKDTRLTNAEAKKVGITPKQLARPTVVTAEETKRDQIIARKREEEAQAKAAVEIGKHLTHPEANNAATDWNEFKSQEAPEFADLTDNAKAAWVNSYVEALLEDDHLKAISEAQKQFELELEPHDVKTNTAANTGTGKGISSSPEPTGKREVLQENKPEVHSDAGTSGTERATTSRTIDPQRESAFAAVWNHIANDRQLPTWDRLSDSQRYHLLDAGADPHSQERAVNAVVREVEKTRVESNALRLDSQSWLKEHEAEIEAAANVYRQVSTAATPRYVTQQWYKDLPERHQEIVDRIAQGAGGKIVNLPHNIIQDPSMHEDGTGSYDVETNQIAYSYEGECLTGNTLEFLLNHELAHAFDIYAGRSNDASLWGVTFNADGTLLHAHGKFAKASERLYTSGKVDSLAYPLDNLYNPGNNPDSSVVARARDKSLADKTQLDRGARGRKELYAQLRAIVNSADQDEANIIRDTEPELYNYLVEENKHADKFAEKNEASFAEWSYRYQTGDEDDFPSGTAGPEALSRLSSSPVRRKVDSKGQGLAEVLLNVDSKQVNVATAYAKESWRTLLSKALLPFRTLDNIVEKFEHTPIGAPLMAFYKGNKQAEATMKKREAEAAPLLNSVQSLPPVERDKLSKAMNTATLNNAWGNLPLEHQDNAHLKSEDEDVRKENISKWAEAKSLHDTLSKPAQELYSKIFELTTRWMKDEYMLKSAALRDSYMPELKTLLPKEVYARLEKAYADPTFGVRETKSEASKALKDEISKSTAAAALFRQMNRDIEEAVGPVNQLAGPYVPLMRFGDYLIDARSKEFLAAGEAHQQLEADYKEWKDANPDLQKLETAREILRDAASKPRTATNMKTYLELKKELADVRKSVKPALEEQARRRKEISNSKAEFEKMAQDEKHFLFEKRESSAAAQKRANELKDQGYAKVSHQLGMEYIKQAHGVSSKFVEDLQNRLSARLPQSMQGTMNTAIKKLWIESHSDQSSLKHLFMQRRGIQGFSSDFPRVFASFISQGAHRLANIEHFSEIQQALDSIGRTASAVDREHSSRFMEVANEMLKRYAIDVDYKDTKWQNRLAGANHVWTLGMSPAYLLQQTMQTPMLAVPMIGARHGFGQSYHAFGKAWLESKNIMTAALEGASWRNAFKFSLDPMDPKYKLEDGERAMLKSMFNMGLLDILAEQDIGEVASGSKIGREYGTALDYINLPARQLELHNRLTTGLMAYRLEMKELAKRSDLTQEQKQAKAELYTSRMITNSQIDYTGVNAPRLFKSGAFPAAKLVTQFKKYQFAMMFTLAGYLGKSLEHIPSGNPEALKLRTEARRAFMGLLTTNFLMAGTMGIPLYFPLMMVAKALSGAMGGGDKDDPELEYKNWLSEQGWVGDMLKNGLPALMNLNLTQGLGQGDIFNPLPFYRGGKNEEEKYNSLWQAALPPVANTFGLKMAQGIDDFHKGRMLDGWIKVVPRWAAGPLRADKLATQGITDKGGVSHISPDKFDAWDTVMSAAGIPLNTTTSYYERVHDVAQLTQEKADRKASILRDAADGENVSEAMAQYNQDYPKERITVSDVLKHKNAMRKKELSMSEKGIARSKSGDDISRYVRY